MKYLLPQTASNVFASLIGPVFLLAIFIQETAGVTFLLLLAGAIILPFLSVFFFLVNLAIRWKRKDWSNGFSSNLLLVGAPLAVVCIYILEIARNQRMPDFAPGLK